LQEIRPRSRLTSPPNSFGHSLLSGKEVIRCFRRSLFPAYRSRPRTKRVC
jgi:hypothetical protein